MSARTARCASAVNALLKLLAYFEKWKLLFGNENIRPRLRVPPHVGLVALDKPAAETADLNSIAFYHRQEESIKNRINQLLGLLLGQICLSCQRFNKL